MCARKYELLKFLLVRMNALVALCDCVRNQDLLLHVHPRNRWGNRIANSGWRSFCILMFTDSNALQPNLAHQRAYLATAASLDRRR